MCASCVKQKCLFDTEEVTVWSISAFVLLKLSQVKSGRASLGMTTQYHQATIIETRR